MNLIRCSVAYLCIISILLGIALWLSLKDSAQTCDNTDAVLEAIHTRTSIRAYEDKAIGSDTIESILRAGMAAPTAVNRQPWKFIVVDDKAKLRQIEIGRAHV